MRQPVRSSAPSSRQGMVMLAVLVVVTILSLSAYHYADLVMGEQTAMVNATKIVQARAAAQSGLTYATALLTDANFIATNLNGNPFVNEDVYRDQSVGGDGSYRFSLIAPNDPESTSTNAFRYGVLDEGSKININALLQLDPSGKKLNDVLVKLPYMTEEIAASIVDWVDADSSPRSGGAESEVYSAMQPPYRPKNGPLDSLEELLLVRGVTPELLFGDDKNRNGIQDANESGSPWSRGWSAYLTIHSREQMLDGEGLQRIYVNSDDVNDLYESLSPQIGDDLAKFVILYRQYGPSTTSGKSQSLGGMLGSLFGGNSKGGKGGKSSSNSQPKPGVLASMQLDPSKKLSKTVKSFWVLLDSQVSVPSKDPKGQATIYTSPLKDSTARRELLPKLFDKATTSDKPELPARINVNTAPREVLLAIPNLTENDVASIMSLRPSYAPNDAPNEVYQTPAWLSTEVGLKADTLQKIEPYVTTQTQVYRVQAIGYSQSGKGPTARLEAVIDVNAGRPRVLSWRDLGELGKGF